MTGIIDRLKRKKLVQWSLAYAAGAWLVIQVLDTVAEPWGISTHVVRGFQFVVAVGFVAAIIVAWFHGEQGRQRVGSFEALLFLALAVVTVAGFPIVMRSGPDVGMARSTYLLQPS